LTANDISNTFIKKRITRHFMTRAAKVSTKGQIVIPGPMRKKHRLEPGTEVDVYEYGNVICIAPHIAESIAAAYGILPAVPSLADELLLDRTKEKCR
jgi:AbrB family looped-hinge helix DNA binding protein